MIWTLRETFSRIYSFHNALRTHILVRINQVENEHDHPVKPRAEINHI
jgi:hypothetical protein